MSQIDKYYGQIIQKYSLDIAKKAGYRKELLNNLNSDHVSYTPININAKNGDTILLISGSFAPVHNGHINLIDTAKKYYTEKGYSIAASYLSPCHDKYVVEKKTKNNIYNINNRIEIIKNKIEKKDIFIDLWESIAVEEDVNFTTVLEHLKISDKQRLNIDINPILLYGSDHINFSYAFMFKGKSFCLKRQGVSNEEFIALSKKFKNTDFYLKNNEESTSSSFYRKNT